MCSTAVLQPLPVKQILTELASGYLCFLFSIGSIGVVVALIGDVASHMGCFIELKDTINAITFIAMGTALPDTFASRQAAIQVRQVRPQVAPLETSK